MIRLRYRAGSHDNALLALYEEHARLCDAEAAGAHSSAHIMLTGHFAPLPASTGGARVRWQDVEWKCLSCDLGSVVGHAWAAPARHSAGGAGTS